MHHAAVWDCQRKYGGVEMERLLDDRNDLSFPNSERGSIADASVVKPRLLLLAINVVPEFLFSICRPRNLYVAANCAEVNNRKDIYPTNVCVTVQPFMDIYSCKVTDVV